MVYTPHEPVKPEVLVNQYVGLVERQLVLPQLFARRGIDQFRGAEGDQIQIKVPGRLAARRYGFRNDRTNPIKFDIYKENKVTVTFGDLIYSGVAITDEQVDFDETNANGLLPVQSRAVGEELNAICSDALLAAPFPVVVGGVSSDLRHGLAEARRVMDLLRVPSGPRYLLVGSDFELALLLDDKLNLASNVGDAAAASTFQNAQLGNRYGFNIVKIPDLPGDTALAVVGQPAVLLTGAPWVPQDGVQGATTSYNGVALRWLRNYDFDYREDRSTVDTYVGTELVKDVYVQWDNGARTDDVTPATHKGEIVGSKQYFTRAIKLTLTGTSTGPSTVSGDDSYELYQSTGLSAGTIWNHA